MSRAVLIALVVSIVFTIATVPINSYVHTTTGPAHFWADLSWSAAIASWLIVAMMWCTDRVVASNRNGWKKVGAKVDRLEEHLGDVEDRVLEIDRAGMEANAVVVQLFKHHRSVN